MAKMDVFISWSGQRSRAVAEALKKYLPMIVNDLNPWLSSTNIDKGSRSSEEIAAALANARAGIICLTPNNLQEPWILFEAGAIAKTVREKPLACTLLIGLQITDLAGPLTQFQATKPTQPEMLHLVKTLNKALGESAVEERQVEATFELCWPKLKETLDNLPDDGSTERPKRDPREMLEELIDLARTTSLYVADLNLQTREHFQKSATITQAQLDHLTNILTPPSPLAQNWFASLSSSDGSSEIPNYQRYALDALYGKASPSKSNISNYFREITERPSDPTPKDEPNKK